MPCRPLSTAPAETSGKQLFRHPAVHDAGHARRRQNRRERDRQPHHLVAEAGAVVLEEHLGAGHDGADRGHAGEHAFEPAVFDVSDHAARLPRHRRDRRQATFVAHDRSSEILSRKIVDAIVALCGWPRRNACANFLACS